MHSQKPPHSQNSQNKQPSKFVQWIHAHHLALTLVLGAIVVTAVFNIALLSIKHDSTSHVSTFVAKKKKQPPKPEKFYSPLTGVEVPDKAAQTKPVTAVMIENSPAARPQAGLDKADVVYETVAEGGITRFMALYQSEKPAKIGPVRSLRLYYLEWATPYHASIAHVGGSGNALQQVRGGGYHDLDQFFNAGSYWRSTDRYAPHNVYTSGEKLDALNQSKGHNSSEVSSFQRGDIKKQFDPATSVSVAFSSPLYATNYIYNQENDSYTRQLAGEDHKDETGAVIAPKVVVVLRVSTATRPGPDGYADIVTSGRGTAYVFQKGEVREVVWQKQNPQAPLELLDAEGKPVILARGQTWIAAITPQGDVLWQ